MVCDIYRAQNRLVFCVIFLCGCCWFCDCLKLQIFRGNLGAGRYLWFLKGLARPYNFGGILRCWRGLLLCKLFFCCVNFINKNFYIFLEFF